jgi:hypothetical protein
MNPDCDYKVNRTFGPITYKPYAVIQESEADYYVVVHVPFAQAGSLPHNGARAYGWYKLRARPRYVNPHVRVIFPTGQSSDHVHYRTVSASLDDLLHRIEAKGIHPGEKTLLIEINNIVITKQLNDECNVQADTLKPLHREVLDKVGRFSKWNVQWKLWNEIRVKLTA